MRAAVLCTLLAVALAAALSVRAERAASIEYEFVARPAAVAADYDGPNARFLAIKAIDGARVDAGLLQPQGARTLVLSVHGSGDSFHNNPNGFLAKGLAAAGYAVLGINTRQTGPRVNTDNFMDVRRDLEAAFYTARALGFKTGSPRSRRWCSPGCSATCRGSRATSWCRTRRTGARSSARR